MTLSGQRMASAWEEAEGAEEAEEAVEGMVGVMEEVMEGGMWEEEEEVGTEVALEVDMEEGVATEKEAYP